MFSSMTGSRLTTATLHGPVAAIVTPLMTVSSCDTSNEAMPNASYWPKGLTFPALSFSSKAPCMTTPNISTWDPDCCSTSPAS